MAKVLLVDDSAEIRSVVAEMLVMYGHTVETAETGEEALPKLQATLPDVVVVDQRLPGMSGTQFLQSVRNAPELAGVEVILCSGDDTHHEAVMANGAFDFWLKGSDRMFDAVAKLTERLEHRRLTQKDLSQRPEASPRGSE